MRRKKRRCPEETLMENQQKRSTVTYKPDVPALTGVYSCPVILNQLVDIGAHITLHYLAALHSQTETLVMCPGTQTQNATATHPP